MRRANITKSVLSITSPGTFLKPGDTTLCRKITRDTNEALAAMVESHPSKFAFWASLPLPDVPGSLDEIDRALDHLGAKGFALLTNANGVYLGDASLDPVFEKLNQRQAVVMIHPTTCHLCPGNNAKLATEHRAEPALPLPQHPRPMMEFFFETARAFTQLILSGTIQRSPDITFIIPHCGAVLPTMIERITSYSARVYGNAGTSSDDIRRMFREQVYFDLAGFPFPDQIHGLLRWTNPSRLLYGTDFPFLPADTLVHVGRENDGHIQELFSAEQQRLVYTGNALRLLANT